MPTTLQYPPIMQVFFMTAGASRLLQDLGDGKAAALMLCIVKFYLICIVNHKGAILKTARVLLQSLLVESYQDIDLVHVSGDLLSGSSD